MPLNDWKADAMQYRDVDIAAQRVAEAKIAKRRPVVTHAVLLCGGGGIPSTYGIYRIKLRLP